MSPGHYEDDQENNIDDIPNLVDPVCYEDPWRDDQEPVDPVGRHIQTRGLEDEKEDNLFEMKEDDRDDEDHEELLLTTQQMMDQYVRNHPDIKQRHPPPTTLPPL